MKKLLWEFCIVLWIHQEIHLEIIVELNLGIPQTIPLKNISEVQDTEAGKRYVIYFKKNPSDFFSNSLEIF